MTDTLKGVFVNAAERTIVDIEIQRGVQPMYDMIGCRLVDLVVLPHSDDLFVDDEGLLSLTPTSPMFRIGTATLAGNGIILGGDDATGESCDVHRDAAYYRNVITFTHAAADATMRMLRDALNLDSDF
jgi:hypothetical protein